MIRNGQHALAKPPLGATIDLAHPLAQGIDYAFLFQEGGGAPFDLVGRRTSSLVGGATWVGSQTGAAIKFDGTTGGVQTTYANSVNMTLMARIKTSTTGVNQHIANKDATGRTFQFRVGVANTPEIILFNAAVSAFTVTGAKNVTDGKEHVVAVTWDGATAKLYVDGLLDTSTGLAMTLVTGLTDQLDMGYIAQYSQFFNGLIVWETAYRRALTTAEIAWITEENYAYVAPPTLQRFYALSAKTSTSGGIGISPRGMGIGL